MQFSACSATGAVTNDRRKNQGKRSNTSFSGKNDHAAKTCFYCGKSGHFKRECKKRARDNAKVAVDFACPAVESAKQTSLSVDRVGLEPQVRTGADTALTADGDVKGSRWLVDGGASCHVLGFDPGAYLHNRQRAAIEIQVGGGHKIFCSCVGDLIILATSPQRHPPARIKLRAVRVVPDFGSNLLSGPCMVKAGWSLTQCDGMFTALDRNRHTVFSIPADVKGLYYLSDVEILRNDGPGTSPRIRGQRNSQQHGVGWKRKTEASRFFGPNGRDPHVNSLHAEVVCRVDHGQENRCESPFPLLSQYERRESGLSLPSLPKLHSPSLSVTHNLQSSNLESFPRGEVLESSLTSPTLLEEAELASPVLFFRALHSVSTSIP